MDNHLSLLSCELLLVRRSNRALLDLARPRLVEVGVMVVDKVAGHDDHAFWEELEEARLFAAEPAEATP